MTMCDILFRTALEALATARPVEDGCLITLPCLYPSGRAAQVLVKDKGDQVILSDQAQALLEIRASGINSHRPGVYIAPVARKRGLRYDDGRIQFRTGKSSTVVELVEIAVLIANASVEAAITAIAGYRIPTVEGIRFAFNSFIKEVIPDKFEPKEVTGGCETHKMDYVHSNGGLFVVDPIAPNRMDIDRAFTAHSDIGAGPDRKIKQWIVFDPMDEWRKNHLDLLRRTGAVVKPLDLVKRELPSLVA
jgi:hypothetical protein